MPMYLEAPRKEASSFSRSDISTLLEQMSDKEKSYSLRARSSVQMTNGKLETVYLMFLRNGNESVFERLDNWWNAKAQRALAKRLICTALAEPCAPAATGRMAMRTLAHERALSHVRKMDKLSPEEIRTVFSECIAAEKDMQIFENKLLAVSFEDRRKFQQFNQHFCDFLDEHGNVPALWLSARQNHAMDNPINAVLAEAESHYSRAMLQAFMQFTKITAENRPMSEVDLPLILAFFNRRNTLRHVSAQMAIRPATPDNEQMAAFWASIDLLLNICDRLRCAPTPSPSQSPAAASDVGCTAMVPSQSRPFAGNPAPESWPTVFPALQASLFQSVWACSAGRSASAVHAASKALMPVAGAMVRHPALAAAPAAQAAPAAPPMRAAHASTLAPKPILPAPSPRDIVCDYRSELDLADIDRQAVILVASEGRLFSMSPACHQWLAELGRSQRIAEAHFVRVRDRGRTVLLARAQRSPLQGHMDGAAIRRLGDIYQAAVATAVAQRRPICLTDLFDDDPHTVDQCVEAMLAPVRRCYREGLQPAIHIRVSSPRLRERIVAALNLLLAPPPAERAAVEVVDRLTEADRQAPGLIMVSGDSADPLNRKLARRHAQQARTAAPGAALFRVGPRRQLGSNARTHLYFYARPCPLKEGLPDGARIAGEYAALFEAARQHGCKLVTLEALSETPGHEGRLTAALSAAILAARARTPDLKVRILTRNEKIRDGMLGCF